MITKKSIDHLRRLVNVWCKMKSYPTKYLKKDIETFIKLEREK